MKKRTRVVAWVWIFLLTDRPGGWANPQSETRNPQ